MISLIVERNNAAVQLLQDGLYGDASDGFKLAMLHFQVSLRSPAIFEEEPMEDANTICTVSCPRREEVFCKTNPSSNEPQLHAVPVDLQGYDVADAYMVLFDRAFCLPKDESRERVISSVILYNCGLASHLSGVVTGNSKNLLNAMKLYKYACRILLEDIVNIDETNSTELLRLALYNNMAHAGFQLCHVVDAEHYVGRLREEMGIANDEAFGAPLETVEDDDYDFFCFNATIRAETTGAAAA